MNSTVGIAIPAYGRARHLRATLESALGQTRPAQEIIVVDDCSPDETGPVTRSFAGRGVTYIRNPRNLGVPANYNEALGKTTADYVMLLEDHDLIQPTYIQKCAALMDSTPDIVLVTTASADIDEATGAVLRVFNSRFPPVMEGRRLAKYLTARLHSPVTLVAMIRRSALAGLEPWFDPRYGWYADIDLWMRLALRGDFGYVAEPLLHRRRREPDHYLNEHPWQSLVACDRIRCDNWGAVFPDQDWTVRLRQARYFAARDYEAMKIVLSRLASGRRDIPDDAWRMMTRPGRLAADLMSRMPMPGARALRYVHRALADLQARFLS